MSKKTNPTLIGIFVIGGIAILISAIVILGSGRFFTKHITYISFFSGSVKGLSIGSPVRFRGAEIGKVRDIRLELLTSDNGAMVLPVSLDLSIERINHIAGHYRNTDRDQAINVMNKLIKEGVKANLAMDSIVTGQLYVELDFHPNEPIIFQRKNPHLLEIPTIRSPLEKIKSTLAELPIDELITSATKTLKNIDNFFDSSAIPQTIKNIDGLTLEIQKTLTLLNTNIPNLSTGAKNTLQSLQLTLNEAQETLKTFSKISQNIEQTVIAETSPLRNKLYETINQIDETARSLENLSDYLQRNPESIIFGKHQQAITDLSSK